MTRIRSMRTPLARLAASASGGIRCQPVTTIRVAELGRAVQLLERLGYGCHTVSVAVDETGQPITLTVHDETPEGRSSFQVDVSRYGQLGRGGGTSPEP